MAEKIIPKQTLGVLATTLPPELADLAETHIVVHLGPLSPTMLQVLAETGTYDHFLLPPAPEAGEHEKLLLRYGYSIFFSPTNLEASEN